MEFLAKKVLDFWFGEPDGQSMVSSEKKKRWFMKDKGFDAEIRAKFSDYLEPARMGAFDRWTEKPEAAVALIVMLDQFPRNIFRGEERSFYYDKKAMTLAEEFAAKGLFLETDPHYGYFSLMPFMHTENQDLQEKGVALFSELKDKSPAQYQDMLKGALNYAVAHRDIIKRFGRFPHRNSILKRENTPEETEFLKEPGSSF